MALFKQRYPDLTVQQENIPNPEYMTKFTAAVVANTRPDVSMVVAERLPDMLGMNGLVDVTARVNAWPNKSAFPANCWEGVQFRRQDLRHPRLHLHRLGLLPQGLVRTGRPRRTAHQPR